MSPNVDHAGGGWVQDVVGIETQVVKSSEKIIPSSRIWLRLISTNWIDQDVDNGNWIGFWLTDCNHVQVDLGSLNRNRQPEGSPRVSSKGCLRHFPWLQNPERWTNAQRLDINTLASRRVTISKKRCGGPIICLLGVAWARWRAEQRVISLNTVLKANMLRGECSMMMIL